LNRFIVLRCFLSFGESLCFPGIKKDSNDVTLAPDIEEGCVKRFVTDRLSLHNLRNCYAFRGQGSKMNV
jgi:hypothetical protein